MRKLALKTLLIVAPFAAVALAVAWTDPFDYFPWSAGRPAGPRGELAYRMAPALWKLSAFRRHPAPHVLLGDSRMASLDADSIAARTGAKVANLGYGGGSLDEAIKTFWVADSLVALESATFGVNLDLYNEANAKDRVTGTLQMLSHPGIYLCDRLVLRATWATITTALGAAPPAVGVPAMDPAAFWKYQLDVTARVAYEGYRYPEGYRRRLEAVAARCRERNIRLRFVIFPEHRDLTAVAARFTRGDAAARMKSDLERIAETVDLGAGMNVTDRSRFIDPYHFAPEVEREILQRLW